MAARTNWKVLTVGAALAGLGITGAGIAMADSDGSESSQIKPIEVSAAQEPTAPVGDKVDRGADDLGGKAVDDTADTPDDANDSPDNTPDDDTPDNTPDDIDDTPDDTADDADDTADDTPED